MLLADSKLNQDPLYHPIAGKGVTAVNIDTLRNTGIVCAILILIAIVVRTQLRRDKPTPLQNLLEWFVDGLRGQINVFLGERPIQLAPVAITLFAFIIVCNMVGLIPGLKSPTNDANTAIALSLLALGIVHSLSVKFRGPLGYVAHYFSVVTPGWTKWFGLAALFRILFGLIEILIAIATLFTLAFRLFFNILVGELMLAVLIFLLSFAAAVVGGGWVFFSIFVGIIQAFIFTVLTVAYVGQYTETHSPTEDPGTAGAEAAH